MKGFWNKSAATKTNDDDSSSTPSNRQSTSNAPLHHQSAQPSPLEKSSRQQHQQQHQNQNHHRTHNRVVHQQDRRRFILPSSSNRSTKAPPDNPSVQVVVDDGRQNNNNPNLKAPYLGSLSRSADYLRDVPPISLGDGEVNTTASSLGIYPMTPPNNRHGWDPHRSPPDYFSSTTTSNVSYGSLRDSQQRGRFLDGPASYREPRSGLIKPLERSQNSTTGVTTTTTSSAISHCPSSSHDKDNNQSKSTLSIGERLQRSHDKMQQKKKQQQEKQQQLLESSQKEDNSNNATQIQQHAVDREQSAATTTPSASSLSVMMQNEASKTTMNAPSPPDARLGGLGQESFVPIHHLEAAATGGRAPMLSRSHTDQYYDPPTMLSTSLTALEFLRSSNHRDPQQEQQQQHSATNATGFAATTDMILSHATTATETAPFGSTSANQNPSDTAEYGLQQQQPPPRAFSPLARSMSDPTPHLLPPLNQQAWLLQHHRQQQTLRGPWSPPGGNAERQTMLPRDATATTPQYQSCVSDQNPESLDAAFGDMEM